MDTAPRLTSTEVIDGVRAAREAESAAASVQLDLALEWAYLHPCPANQVPAHWGEAALHDEDIIPLAGEGAPWVAEFAPADLGAALNISLDAARQLLGDALELGHRLPRLHALVRTGRVPAWRARLIARETRDLSLDAAAFADRLVAATPDRVGRVHAARLVQEARLYFDPDRAVADEDAALARRGVWLRHGEGAPATTDVSMTLDTPDALLLDGTITRIAADLRELGDTEDLDVRRARAVGILADPQYALDLMTGRETAAPTTATGGIANLFVHLTSDDLAHDAAADATAAGAEASTGVASLEKLGAATTSLLTDWLSRFADRGAKLIIRPVLDLSQETAVDQHDPPAPMREAVVLRDAHCVFPGCRRDSRSCDLDHITEYLPLDEGGPPGQTCLSNLAPLCRTHHRSKTHAAWDYKRTDDGAYVWTTPTGHQYTVFPTSRRPPRQPRPPRRA